MKKARILLTLCLVAVLTLGLSLSVSADEVQYTEIQVESLPVAAVGQAIEPYSYTPAEGTWNYGAYTVSGAWHIYDYATQTTSPASGTFEDGKVYQLQLTATLNPGWAVFEYDYLVDLGQRGHYAPVAATETSRSYVITAALREYTYMDEIVVVGLPEGIAAGEAITNPTVTLAPGPIADGWMRDGATITAQWVNADGTEATGTFQDGKIYYLNLTVSAKEGYLLQEYVNVRDWEHGASGYGMSTKVQAVVPIRYSLQPKISEIVINGVTDAVIGQTPTVEGVTVPADAKYTIENLEWWDVESREPATTFEDGKKYELDMYVVATTGHDIDENATVIINGRPMGQFTIYGNMDRGEVRVYYSFLQQIDAVDVTVPAPAVGQTATLEGIVLPEGVELEEEQSYWYDVEEGHTPFTGTFLKGHKYRLYLNLMAKDGYEFTEDTVLTMNGKPMDYNDTYGHLNDKWGYLEAMYSFVDVIDKVEITGVTAPVIGQTATTEGIQISGATMSNAAWYKEGDESGEPFTGVFQAGEAYYIDVRFEAAEGAEFGNECVITINGKEAYGGYAWDKEGYAQNRYSFKTVISKVEITGMPQYAVGGTASVESLKIPEGANYELNAFWQSNESENFTGTFENNNIYGLVILVEPKAGYEFAEDLELLIDGKAPATNFAGNDESFAYAQFYFLPGATLVDKVEITAPTPVIGADIDNEDIKVTEGVSSELGGYWWVSEDGKSWSSASGKFEEGKYYRFEFSVNMDTEAGIYMADNAKVYLNGILLNEEEQLGFSPAYVYGERNYGLLCNHTYGAWEHKDNKDAHSHTCTKCGNVATENHVWESDKDGKCDTCGYVRSDNPPTGDAGMALALVTAMISLGGVLMLTKKKEF